MKYFIINFLFCLIWITSPAQDKLNKHQIETNTFSKDGAWCWFSGPRAIYAHSSNKEIITGWVKSDGSIEAGKLNLDTRKILTLNVVPQLEIDDHANPAFVELGNKDVLMFYAKHSDDSVRMVSLTGDNTKMTYANSNNVSPFSDEQLKLYPVKRVTYVNPFVLSDEQNRLYCFGRWTGFKPNMMWSDDNGRTFTPSKVFITNYPFNDENRPYVKYHSDGKSKIHFVFTDGHPRNELTNSVYYAMYEKGAFWRIDGSKICSIDSIPFEPSEASVVYKASPESGRAWVYDVVADKKGSPVILYARYPKETEHNYHYVTHDGKDWKDYHICNSGGWFPQTPDGEIEREPHYSGGMVVHPIKTNTIYLSREINGVFEIEKRTTNNKGENWKTFPITENSEFDNVRPEVPGNMSKDDPAVVLWMVNQKYIHYTDYKTSIQYALDE